MFDPDLELILGALSNAGAAYYVQVMYFPAEEPLLGLPDGVTLDFEYDGSIYLQGRNATQFPNQIRPLMKVREAHVFFAENHQRLAIEPGTRSIRLSEFNGSKPLEAQVMTALNDATAQIGYTITITD